MRYQEFIDILLGTIGYEAAMSGKTEFRVGVLRERYGLEVKPQWRETISSDLDGDYRSRMYRHLGPLDDQRISLSGEGISWFEDYEENFASILEAHGLPNPYQEQEQSLPDDLRMASGRVFVSEGAPPEGFGEEADDFLQTAPAADRIVRLDHNSPEYVQAVAKTNELSEALVAGNDVGQMTADDVSAAKAELSGLAGELRNDVVRVNAFADRAKSLLTWIATQAAGAIVGALAIATLVTLGALLGFTVTL